MFSVSKQQGVILLLLSGADIIIKTIIEQGCNTIFGYPGGQVLDIYNSLTDKDIKLLKDIKKFIEEN